MYAGVGIREHACMHARVCVCVGARVRASTRVLLTFLKGTVTKIEKRKQMGFLYNLIIIIETKYYI